jgi:hypothetical protein
MITIALRKRALRTLSPVRLVVLSSEGYIFLLLYATVVFLSIFGEY